MAGVFDSVDGAIRDLTEGARDLNTRLTDSLADLGTQIDAELGGNPTDDDERGTPGNDRLFGGLGNDTVSGFAGDDLVVGGAGNDRLFSGAGRDVAAGGSGNDTVYGADGFALLFGGGGDDLVLGSTGALIASGGDGRDTLNGSIGLDVLIGGAGDDLMNSGQGVGVHIGGAGADTSYVGAEILGNGRADWLAVLNFTLGQDRLMLDPAVTAGVRRIVDANVDIGWIPRTLRDQGAFDGLLPENSADANEPRVAELMGDLLAAERGGIRGAAALLDNGDTIFVAGLTASQLDALI